MLGRGRLVVLSLRRNAQTPHFLVDFLHKRADSGADASKIVIVHLLSLGRHSPKQGSSRIDQIFSLEIFFLIYQEILLLRAYIGNHTLGCGISKQADNSESLLVNRLHGTEKRRFLIQSLSPIRTEGGGNVKRHAPGIFPQKCRRSAVPGCISPGLESGAQSS